MLSAVGSSGAMYVYPISFVTCTAEEQSRQGTLDRRLPKTSGASFLEVSTRHSNRLQGVGCRVGGNLLSIHSNCKNDFRKAKCMPCKVSQAIQVHDRR